MNDTIYGKYGMAVAFYAVLAAGMLIVWSFFKECAEVAYVNWIGTSLKAIGDIALILLPYCLLPPRWRVSALIPLWIFATWSVINLTYFRFWGDFIPSAAVTMGDNFDGNLMEYGVSLLQWHDLVFLAVPVAASLAYRFLRPDRSTSFSRGFKTAVVLSSLLAGAAGQYSYFHTSYKWKNSILTRSRREVLREHYLGNYTGQKQLYVNSGTLYYGIRWSVDALQTMHSTLELTESQRNDISGFLALYSSSSEKSEMVADSVNVVYVIVESLNSDMLGREIGGLCIMPTLDSLASAPGTVLFDNVVSQIKASSSSDGHLLLMTGLLPPDKVSYSISYGSGNKFPSLADRMPRHEKHLLLADDGVCWNEGNTLRNFGLGDPVTTKNRSASDIAKHGRDGAMLLQAADIVRSAHEPFFMTLMTISMHIPFIEPGWEVPAQIRSTGNLNTREKDYANVCHHFDMYLSEFLKSLPENTIVVIASDHSHSVASGNDTSPAAMMMAINTGRTERITRMVGQVNLFPATLDILGVGGGYRGLAPSAFNPKVNGTRDSYGNIHGTPSAAMLDTLNRAYHISDLILRGDYFKFKNHDTWNHF